MLVLILRAGVITIVLWDDNDDDDNGDDDYDVDGRRG